MLGWLARKVRSSYSRWVRSMAFPARKTWWLSVLMARSPRHGHGAVRRRGSRGGRHGGAADVGLHPGDDLPHGEGLGDIVVRPGLEPADLVVLLLPGGEQQDGHIVPVLAQGLAHVEADHFGQHDVQQDQVRLLRPGLPQALLAVIGLQNAVALPLQVEAENVHDVLLVLYNQDGLFLRHTRPPNSPPPRRAARLRRQRFSSSFAFSTAATVLASSISPSRQRRTISAKGTRSTFKNSSSSRCWSSILRSRARYRWRVSA